MKNRCYNFPNLRWLHQAAWFSHQHIKDVQDTVYYHVRWRRAEHLSETTESERENVGKFWQIFGWEEKNIPAWGKQDRNFVVTWSPP